MCDIGRFSIAVYVKTLVGSLVLSQKLKGESTRNILLNEAVLLCVNRTSHSFQQTIIVNIFHYYRGMNGCLELCIITQPYSEVYCLVFGNSLTKHNKLSSFSYFVVIFSSRFPTYRLVFMLNLQISHVCLSPEKSVNHDEVNQVGHLGNITNTDITGGAAYRS